MARVVGRGRSSPRVYGRLTDTLGQTLTDQAWIVREARRPGTVDGTPNFQQLSYGPYAGLLSNPTWAERRQSDRYETDVTHTLAIASDVRPLPSDLIDVSAGPNDSATAAQNDIPVVRYRVLDVQERTSRFGSTAIFHLQLTRLEED